MRNLYKALFSQESRKFDPEIQQIVPLSRVSPKSPPSQSSTRCNNAHCLNWRLKTLFFNVISYFGSKAGGITPARETPLVLAFDSVLILLRNLGRFPKFLLPELSLLPQFLG
jgi:hypothetical protein